MLKEAITKDLVNDLPVPRDETLLVEIDEVALDYFIALLWDTSIHQCVSDPVLVSLQRVPKSLQFL